MNDIETVNIHALFGAPGAARDACDASIWAGLRRSGSIVITGYPDAGLVDARARTGLQIFDVPEAQKQALSTRHIVPDNPNWYRGFWPTTLERAFQNNFFDVGPTAPTCGIDLPGVDILTETTPWPDPEPSPGWAATVRAHYDHLNGVAQALILSIGRSAGFDEATIRARFDGAHSTLRFLDYGEATADPLPADDGALLSATRHTDSSGLSLLWQGAPGLQAEGQDGVFRDVPLVDNAISVHVGNVMTEMTSGRVPATPHRVLATDRPRQSVGFFLEPALDAPITPADHSGETGLRDTYAWQILQTFSERPRWKGIIPAPAKA